MPRPLSYIQDEIARVASELDVDPRSALFTRAKFLTHGNDLEAPPSYKPTNVTRHDLEFLGGWTKLKQSTSFTKGLPQDRAASTVRGIELRNSYVRKLERQSATSDYFHDRLVASFEEVFANNVLALSTKKYVKPKKKPKKKLLTLLWSDLHFGVDVQDYEVYASRFNWLIASRRIAKLCEEAVAWGDPSQLDLRIVLNGDIMQGVIHLSDVNIKPMTEQIWGACAILTASIDFLRTHFGKITVECMPGNHDRMTYRDKNRAISQRWDSHAHSLYLALKMAFRDDSGVTFNIPTTGIGLSDDLSGGYVLASHGDTEPDPKNVSRKIDTSGLAIKLLKMQESRAIDRGVSIALFGHWHTPTVQMLPNGSWLIVNGSLIGAEPFGQNAIGEFNSQPAQVMFDSVPGEPLNRLRIVQVRSADEDTRYDKIIPAPRIIANSQLVV